MPIFNFVCTFFIDLFKAELFSIPLSCDCLHSTVCPKLTLHNFTKFKKHSGDFHLYWSGFYDNYWCVLIIRDQYIFVSLVWLIIIAQPSFVICHELVHLPRLSLVKLFKRLTALISTSCHLHFSQSMRNTKCLHEQLIVQNRNKLVYFFSKVPYLCWNIFINHWTTNKKKKFQIIMMIEYKNV